MKVFITPSEELSNARVRIISEIISKHNGTIEFIFPKEIVDRDLDEEEGEGEEEELAQQNKIIVLEKKPWSELFTYCEVFRKQNKEISPDDLVVYLTDHGNYNDQGTERNWLSSWDPSGKRNFFIQTSGWEHYIESEECYPIIYELAAFPLFLSTCKDQDEVKAMAHYDPPVGSGPRGCPWDFCGDKTQVELKLRTGDVCPDCREKILEKNIDPAVVGQIFAILDDIRAQILFRRQFELTRLPSKMEIEGNKLIFTDIRNISVRLTDRMMAFYMFFLHHPDGLDFQDMKNHYGQIKRWLGNYVSDANYPRFTNMLNNIVNDGNTKSWLVHHINSRIEETIGLELGQYYFISRKHQVRKDGSKTVEYDHYIPIDRSFIVFGGKAFKPEGKTDEQ